MPPLASTTVLAPQQLLRLALEEKNLVRSADAVARDTYLKLAEKTPVYPTAAPSKAIGRAWVQDARLKYTAGSGVTVGDVVRAIERMGAVDPLHQGVRGFVRVRGVEAVPPRETASEATSARDKLAGDTHRQIETEGPFAKLLDLLRRLRAWFVVLLVVAILFYTWPWLSVLLAARRRAAPRTES